MKNRLISRQNNLAISLDTLADHLRGVEIDEGLLQYRDAAVEMVESITGRAVFQAEYELTMPKFYSQIEIPKPPLRSITSIQYTDTEGNNQTLADTEYTLVNASDDLPAEIWFSSDRPKTKDLPNAVRIRYQAGYENEVDVPFRIKQVIAMMAGDLYKNRESTGVNMFKNETYERMFNSIRIYYL